MLQNKSQKVLKLFANIAEDMGWYGQSVVQSMQLKRKENTWLLVVKVRKKGVDWVCFVEGEDIDDCIDLFSEFCLKTDNTGVKWVKSKY